MKSPIFYLALVALALTPLVQAATPMNSLIIDGQNNQRMWSKTLAMKHLQYRKFIEIPQLFFEKKSNLQNTAEATKPVSNSSPSDHQPFRLRTVFLLTELPL